MTTATASGACGCTSTTTGWSGGQDLLRCFLSAGQGCLDRAHFRAGIERLAGKEYGSTIRFSQG
jgi:hypothetical protein